MAQITVKDLDYLELLEQSQKDNVLGASSLGIANSLAVASGGSINYAITYTVTYTNPLFGFAFAFALAFRL